MRGGYISSHERVEGPCLWCSTTNEWFTRYKPCDDKVNFNKLCRELWMEGSAKGETRRGTPAECQEVIELAFGGIQWRSRSGHWSRANNNN